MAVGDNNSDFRFYRYDPSLAAAVIFIVLFLLATLAHTYQFIRTRTWYLWPVVAGGICMSFSLPMRHPSFGHRIYMAVDYLVLTDHMYPLQSSS